MMAIISRSRWYLLLTQYGGFVVSIFIESDSALAHMFNACTTEQINEFIPEKRSLRIHGQSTTLRLERAFWNVLDEIAHDQKMSVNGIIQEIADQCLVANDKNLASCLRVICLKYLNIYSKTPA